MSTPRDRDTTFWPYGLPSALLAVPLVWLFVILVIGVTERLAAWPRPEARSTVLWITLAVSLVPLGLRLLDLGRTLWRSGAGDADTQGDVLAEIHRNRVVYEDMVMRVTVPAPAAAAADAGTPTPATAEARPAAGLTWAAALAAIPQVTARLDELTRLARDTTDPEMLAALQEEAEILAQQRAFLCPEGQISAEAKSHLVTLENWGVPAKTIEALKALAAPALEATITNAEAARGALHVIFEEYDYWSPYVDEYNTKSFFWASTFLVLIAILALGSLFMMFGWSWKILALVCAAVAGATASVIARFAGLTSYGEWVVNLRAYQTRIGTGIVGSLVGIGLLGSGLITITLPAPWQSASALLDACLAAAGPPETAAGRPVLRSQPTGPATTPATDAPASASAQCQGGGMLFVLAVTMLLGFSERLLTSLEGRVVGTAGASPGPARA